MSNSAEISQLKIALEQNKSTLIAVDSIDFTLHPGETLALLGESGCGKSLTAMGLMRLLPHFTLYGQHSRIDIDKKNILDLPEYLMRQLRGHKLSIIFQEPMTALNPVLTIGEQLSECFHGSFSSSDLLDALKEVELPNPQLRLMQYPHELSGGQKQRVVIAMALASKPDILIADEPTTALDVTIQAQILALLKRLQQRYQMSMLLITHDLGVVKAMADNVCVMYAGQIVEYAKVADFFEKTLHPYSRQLLTSLPSFSKRGRLLQVLSGSVPTLDAIPAGCRFHTRCAYVTDTSKTIEPELQTLGNRMVRCHLFPKNTELPPFPNIETEKLPNVSSHSVEIMTVENLSVHFDYRKKIFGNTHPINKAVDDVSFTLKSGHTVALVGESGCGKTTTGRALVKLIPWAAGSVYFHGQNIADIQGRELRHYRRRVQMIFQDPFSSLNPRMTVGDIIAEGMHAQNMSSQHISQKLARLLEQVQLPMISLHKYPHQFSGGQRQRIGIARALATDPEVIICDEPTSSLDVSVQAQILNLLKTLQNESGLAYLFITHNMDVVSWMADTVLVMENGKVVESGSVDSILKRPQNDYTVKLLNSVLKV